MTPNTCAFADLRVKVKRQVVSDGILVPKHLDIHRHWPNHISPQAFHAKLEAVMAQPRSSTAAPLLPVIDMRNHYEAEVGYFRGAVQLNADTFQVAMQQLDQIVAQYDRTQEILMYCTGGIRCTKAGAYLKAKGCKQVSVWANVTNVEPSATSTQIAATLAAIYFLSSAQNVQHATMALAANVDA
ncbi:hypothetical protein H4R34_005202 [Dimargaris verticillata]|uniref:Rhodanese domain-containing protein n=1 Tax=Dimargaris verticillata TaxID=2761393 RepID=A0A9W8EAG4_9FUNG|nr:hypothetical protein H4R34_005202 [Dimargaris verticillata]